MFSGKAFARPEVLGLLLTSKCNLSCRHCCNESHPANSETATLEQMVRLINEAKNLPSIKEIGISGGEPFLYVKLLKQVVEYANRSGYSASVTTNGFWGGSTGADRLLIELRECGLTAINISTSPFHQEFLPFSRLVRAAQIAIDAELKVTINIVSTSHRSSDEVRREFGKLANSVRFVVMPCVPTGRGAVLVEEHEFVPEFAWPTGNCREHFRKLAVDLSGDVYPCCSPGGFTEPLRIGNVRTSTLRGIVESSAQNKLLAILESVGPGFFLPFLRQVDAEQELPARFVDQCHLCHLMLSSPKCKQIVADVSERLVADLAVIPAAERPAVGSRLAALRELESS